MEISATAKYLRVSTRKMRLIADSIRKMGLWEAINALKLADKQASKPLIKVIESCVSNAKVKNIDLSQVKLKNIEVMGGPAMKRWRAVSKGSAHAYKKRMTHVRIILSIPEKQTVIKSEAKILSKKDNKTKGKKS